MPSTLVMNNLPSPVSHYLQALCENIRVCGYVRLNLQHRVIESAGKLPGNPLGKILLNISILEQFSYLEGLLPSGDKPVVIGNVNLSGDEFVDIHLFMDEDDQWLVILDNTEAAIETQRLQQYRLSRSINTESLISSQRCRY